MKGARSVEAPSAPLMVVADAVQDDKQSSLRRAATALLIFSMIGIHHMSGLLGLFAACTVLCSSTTMLGRRTCRVKAAALFAAGFAFVTFSVAMACVIAGAPHHISRAIEKECQSMPADTFEWGKQAIANLNDQHQLGKRMDPNEGLGEHKEQVESHPEFHLSHVLGQDGHGQASNLLAVHSHRTEQGETIVAWYSPHRMLKAVAKLVSPEQTQLCNHVAHFVAHWGSMLLLVGASMEWGLFVSAVIVAVYIRKIQLHRAGTWSSGPTLVVASPVLAA